MNREGKIMKRLGLLILLSCMVFLSGCQQENHSEENRTDNNIVETQEDVSTIAPESIVSVQCGQFDYAEGYSTLPSLASDSEEIIYGEIVAIDYLVENGHCRTNSEVQIIKSIKGNFSEGEIIRVVEDQGVVSVREYIDSHDSESAQEINRSYFEQYPDEELGDIYIQQLEQGDVMAEKGQRNLYFLEKSPFYDTENTYCRLAGPDWKYTEISDDNFACTQTIGMQLSGNYRLKTFSQERESEGEIQTYTLEELIGQMEL